jgi:cytochrome c biogenesis protein CcmG/thiol:disulfide interchange protein DsbE
MANYATPGNAVRLFIAALLILASAAGTIHAKNAPDSIDIVQSILPDSTPLKGKVVYVDFWASWCVPCRHSFPWMQEMYEKYHQKGFEIVAVGVDKDHKAAVKFLDEIKPSFSVVYDSTGHVAKQYGLETMPTSFIYGRDGRLVMQNNGFRPDETDSLDGVIGRLVNKGEAK